MKIIFGLIFLLAALVGSWFTPWSQPRAMITVTGEAKQAVANQIANFNVSVTQTNKDKQVAVEAVNQEMDKIIKTVKELGIEAKDITTQNVSVYEMKKQWQASNSLEIILRNIDQAQALADLLQGFPLAQVFGPGFSVDDASEADADLLTEAVADARQKAAKVAAASGRKLGKVITVSETGSYPIYRGLEAASSRDAVSTPIEPGSSQMSQIVTVVFELK